MLVYPHINPIALHIGPLKIRWYGIMYLIGFAAAWGLGLWRARKSWVDWDKDDVADLIFYTALGGIIGGRFGYMLFYDLSGFLHNPLIFFKVWDGGMSFHGGLIGVLVSVFIFAKRNQRHFFAVADFLAPLVPIGLAAGRLGNFINGELWGRVTHVPWGIAYPQAGPQLRHPSEIYELLLEGVVLFVILWLYSAKTRPRMAVSGLFLLGYGCFRFFCEFFRQPDPQLGFIAFGWLTMGQLLSTPMVIFGAFLLVWAYAHKQTTTAINR